MDIKVSGRKVAVTDALHDYVDEKIGDALKVFDIQPMTCDVVLRVEKNRSNPEAAVCEVTVRVRDNVVRVESADNDMYAAIDIAADKVTRQIRKFKTKIVDRRQRAQGLPAVSVRGDLADLLEPLPEEDDELVREKVIDLPPMTEQEALVQTDLIGHDFYVFTNATTGLINVIYHRKNGGYGIIKPKIEEPDE
ncbi:ribosome hibernation-promoting factor, HPF/YfiA family [uncultured Parolsenella sp.]|uniref:ribosome hibernation-promoting factor, HPF/YfiA family n=1 Tax=uncultured Parolsenella sp. TaxID=2083008 RepID=UPI0027D962A6|nr:ribosome-associated translation inhibitor RaiA [uncultured Parolsenella sp.]